MIISQISTSPEEKHATAGQAAKADSPGVIVFPPALFVGAFLVSLVPHFFWPLHLGLVRPVRSLGGIVIVASGALAIWGRKTMTRAGTNVLPSKPALTMVMEGPFRFTRNPLYVANVFTYLGLTLISNSVWPLFFFAPMLCVLHWGIIRREERYLENKFGEPYLAYKSRVRRYL